ncbi:MAG: tRNA (N6-isopentenyl adenosine(37)-C2)-methylthiotransferase MiaB [Alphaproteobacteria bacterium]|nr:tRNA (N6-isopentenyl adenosine(37)-C2)-methylthiotransferase MiaB [Alphaproteobacteria bacterium]
MTKKLFVKTFGCQMNVYDSARMVDLMRTLGFEETNTPEDADMIIFNTCHIREKASEKIFSELGRFRPLKEQRRKQGRDLILVVAGCVVQAESEEFMNRAKFVDIALGPQTYHRLPEMLRKLEQKRKQRIIDVEFPAVAKFDSLPQARSNGVSSFLAIQEGCDRFCSYCVVPYTRGAEYSRSLKEIVEEARHLAETGTKDLMLLGQNVNAWHGEGLDGQPSDLSRLVKAVAEIDGIERIRYVTSYPSDFTDDMIAMHRDIPKVMPYLHLPVQSGSDRILKKMNRRYTCAEYEEIVSKLRAACPKIALSSDFIVGFPEETDEDFEQTMALVRRVTFAQSYSFKYSARPGTPAAAMKNQVPEEVKTERLERLQALLIEQHAAYNAAFLGQETEILLEEKAKKAGFLLGHTPQMQNVVVKAPGSALGQIVRVRITKTAATTLDGELI